jgi:FKBP-type peptidyl-prolyl cis-trans isomerase FkpA
LKKILVAVSLSLASVTGCAQMGAMHSASAPAVVTELVKKDVKVGEGKLAENRKAVLVGYTGWLYDPKAPDMKGEQFDSSVGRVTPFGFIIGAGRVIKGWDQGIPGMREGGKRTLIIPPELGYGARGSAPKIPPNAALVFDVELIKVLN